MNKQEFFERLRKGLSGFPEGDVEERIAFLREMIDDRMEEGLSEEEAVAEIGSVDEMISQILDETPLSKIVKEKIKHKGGIRPWELVLLILGSPIWVSLLLVAFAVVLSVYVVLWAVIISLWAVEVSVAACSLGGILGGVVLLYCGEGLPGIALIGAGLVLAGLSVFFFFGCRAATRGTVWLTKKIGLGIKRCFVKKETVK